MAEVCLPGNVLVRLEKGKSFPRITIEDSNHYYSPNRTITGRFLNSADIQYYQTLGVNNQVNADETAIEVDFTPAGRITPPQNRAEILEARDLGIPDFEHFLDSLRSKAKFRNLGLIVGRTNPRMANFMVRRFGFHYSNNLPENDEERNAILGDLESRVTIFITKEELLGHTKRGTSF